MPLLTRINLPRHTQATGMIAPLMRVATHTGYCTAIAGREYIEDEDSGPDEKWAEAWSDIKDDLGAALEHLENPPERSAFVSADIINMMDSISASITAIREATATKDEVFEALQVLNHNIAHVAAQYERETSGFDATEGSAA